MTIKHKNFIRRRFGLTAKDTPIPIDTREISILQSIVQEQQELLEIYIKQLEGYKILIEVRDQEMATQKSLNTLLTNEIAEHMTWKWPFKRIWQMIFRWAYKG
jgi:small-conductance mechanosensitive channel